MAKVDDWNDEVCGIGKAAESRPVLACDIGFCAIREGLTDGPFFCRVDVVVLSEGLPFIRGLKDRGTRGEIACFPSLVL